MVRASVAALCALAVAPVAYATVFMTSPVSSTTCAAGSQCTVSWEDDGNYPSLSLFGNSSVGVYAGSQQEQTLLQLITSTVNVSTTKSIIFTPTASIGPNSADYFIKFESLTLKQNGSTFPEEAFSAKFTLSGMSGQFNASVQAEINGASSSSGASSTSATTTSTSKSSSSTGSSTSKTSSGTTSSASTTASSGAERLVAGSAVGAVSLGAILLSLL
jgi:hypothetical protein